MHAKVHMFPHFLKYGTLCGPSGAIPREMLSRNVFWNRFLNRFLVHGQCKSYAR